MPRGPVRTYKDNNERLREVAKSLREKPIQPRRPVKRGNQHEWDQDTYMELCNSACYFCGDWTYNYMTRLDETRNFHPDNLVSECANCRHLREDRTLQEYKTLAEGVERGRPIPKRNRT